MDVVARERGEHLVGVHVRRRARPRLEDVDRELVVELAGRDPVAGGRDPRRLVAVEEPELAVHARRRRLDAAEPARHRRRDRLARHREVLDRLPRLATPQLAARRRLGHGAESTPVCRSSRLDALTETELDRPLAQVPPGRLVERRGMGPTEITAAWALAVRELARLRPDDQMAVAAAETFDGELHVRSLGGPARPGKSGVPASS